MIDARQHVPGVADAEVADVQRSERLAVAGAAAVVRLEDERAARRPDVDRIDARARERRRPRRPRRAAVNDDEQRILPAGLEAERLVQDAFDRRAVLAFPRDDLERA